MTPVTSVDYEQDISTLNSIKTDKRSSMVVHRADCLTLLSVESKPFKEFNFDVAIE